MAELIRGAPGAYAAKLVAGEFAQGPGVLATGVLHGKDKRNVAQIQKLLVAMCATAHLCHVLQSLGLPGVPVANHVEVASALPSAK